MSRKKSNLKRSYSLLLVLPTGRNLRKMLISKINILRSKIQTKFLKNQRMQTRYLRKKNQKLNESTSIASPKQSRTIVVIINRSGRNPRRNLLHLLQEVKQRQMILVLTRKLTMVNPKVMTTSFKSPVLYRLVQYHLRLL